MKTKTKTRVLSLLMTLAMLLTSFVVVIPASAEGTDSTPWHLSSDVATAFAGGSGTPEDPYQIATAGQLAYLAKLADENTTDASNADKPYRQLAYVVTADIDATAHQWTAIGVNTNNDFEGVFDGGNYTITTVLNDVSNEFYGNNTTNSSGTAISDRSHGGLFGRIDNATVKNVKLDFTFNYSNRSTLKSTNSWFGFFACSIYNKCIIDNVHINMHVTGSVTGSNMLVTGGMAAYFNATTGTAEGSRISNCSVGGSLNVETTSQIAFSSFFGAMSGQANGVAYFDNLVVTTDITLTKCGHQDLIGSFCGRSWNGTAGATYKVTNFVDASKITTTKATNYLHYGTLHSFPTGASAQNFVVDGLVAMQDLQLYACAPGGSGNKACVSNLMSGSKFTNVLPMEFDNIYTTNPLLPDFYTQDGTIGIDTDGDATADTAFTGAGVAHNADFVNTATFDYVVDKEAGTIAITIPAALYNTFDAIGNVVVGYGSKTTAEYTDNKNGTYTFVVGYVAGGAGFITVDQTVDVEGTDKVTGDPITTAVKTGTTFTLNDKWTTYAEPITKNANNSTSNPYEITSETELAYVAFQHYTIVTGAAPATVYYSLGDDLDLSHRNWVPIGSYVVPTMQNADFRFGGSLYGKGHTINGLTITDRAHADDEPAALFGATKTNCPIKDLYMTNVNINVTVSSSSTCVGVAAIVNFASGSTSITNVHVDGNVYATLAVSEAYVGGLVSWGNNVNLTNCSMSGAVTAKSNSNSYIPIAGGLIGVNGGYGTTKNSVNYATVTVSTKVSNSIAGGIMGATKGDIDTADKTDTNANDYQIIDCVNAGNIVVTGKDASNMRLGGIVGAPGRGGVRGSLEITGCVNLGQMKCSDPGFKTGGASGVGQIAGYTEIAPHNSEAVTQRKGLIIENCFGVPSATENNVMVTAQASYTKSESDIREIWVNEKVNTSGNPHLLLEDAGNTMLFEIDTDGKTVTVSKAALDILLNVGFEMTLTYGTTTITNVSAAATVGSNYVWTFAEAANADATLELEYTTGDAPVPVTVSARKATWAGMFAANTFASDDPATDAIEIANAAELGYLAKLMNSVATYASVQTASFILTKDIDLSGAEWTPIAPTHVGGYAFKGIFDGDNNKILNMTLTAESYAYNQAFIGRAEGDFAMQNVTFVNPVIKAAGSPLANQTVSAVVTAVGSLYGGTITNVHVTGLDLYVANAHFDAYIGGLVGYLGNPVATVTNCSAAGKIVVFATENTALKVGGVVSRSKYGKVLNSSSAVDIAVTTDGNTQGTNVGGIIGQVNGDEQSHKTVVTNVAHSGSITVTHTAIEPKALLCVGGIIGRMMKGTLEVTNAFNGGKIEVTSANQVVINKAAIVGYIENKDVTTTVSGASDITGLVAMNGAVVEDANAYNGDLALGIADGARVRIAADCLTKGSGLRFDGKVDLEVLEQLKAAYGAENVEVGITITTIENYNAVKGDWNALVEGVKTGKIEVTATTFNKVAAEKVGTVEDYQFAGSIVNLFESNYNRKFVATSYLTITIAEGVTVTVYAGVDVARTMADVADAAIADHNDPDTATKYSEEALALLALYAAAND